MKNAAREERNIWQANTIAGFSIPLYLGILALVVVCMYMDCLPAGLVGGMIALMVLGEGLNFFRKSYTGCENVPGRIGHLYSGGGGYPGAGADSGADA